MTFAWRRRATRHFGDQWVPFAEIGLRTTSGKWRTFAVQVDTGAVISVLHRSAADLLGIQLQSGRPVDLVSVGSSPRPYFVHEVPARIADLPEFLLRVAIADGERVPNLLGRLDVIERLRIDLDAAIKATRITMPEFRSGASRP